MNVGRSSCFHWRGIELFVPTDAAVPTHFQWGEGTFIHSCTDMHAPCFQIVIDQQNNNI